MIDPSGVFEIGALPLAVSPDGEGWKVVFPGVPEGFEPGLSGIDDTTFVIERGPFGGAVLSFEDEDAAHAGPIPVHRLNGEYREPPGYRLAATCLQARRHARPGI